MELVLTKNAQNQIIVTCNGLSSHNFPLKALIPKQDSDKVVLTSPVETGKRLFALLFAEGSSALAAWDVHPKRILLVADDPDLDIVPWEYLYAPNGFIVVQTAFVRGLPRFNRRPTPDLTAVPLHIIAIPSNPIANDIVRLDIAGEWKRLKDSLLDIKTAICLERVRPPTLEQTRRLVANQRYCIVHFMGHGGHDSKDSILLFENQYGAPRPVTAHEFIPGLGEMAFLVTLNACATATPGDTEFSNLARVLVEHGVPYALGMRFSIPDDDAKNFSETFYSKLARGTSVENALHEARSTLLESGNVWAVGTPVLYTSLNTGAKGFETHQDTPRINEHQPPLELSILPRAGGAFQGRVDELLALGQALTGDELRPKLLTIYAQGGQGKTVLAREAAERFAYAWPGGVLALSLEKRPNRIAFCCQLAQFLKLPTNDLPQQVELEHHVLSRLRQQRILMILDNAESFIEALRAGENDALDLAQFLQKDIPDTTSLIVTSREPLNWHNEQMMKLKSLSKLEGAMLFKQSTLQRQNDVQYKDAETLSVSLDGHPLGLLLLGLAFSETNITMNEFIAEYETHLINSENRYETVDHHHRTLYSSIETSIYYLDDSQKVLLSKLWIFQSPFQAETASQVFIPFNLVEAQAKMQREQIAESLHILSQRGLLVCEIETFAERSVLLYKVPTTVRLFAQHYLEQVESPESLQMQMGKTYTELLKSIYNEINKHDWASYLALRSREDLEACAFRIEENNQIWYAFQLGWVLQRLGDRQAALHWLDRALELAQGVDPDLEFYILNIMANVQGSIGHPEKALLLLEQALSLAKAKGNQIAVAGVLDNIGMAHRSLGNLGKAMELYEQAFTLARTAKNQEVEAVILNNMGEAHYLRGNLDKALELYKQSLSLKHKLGDRMGEATTLTNMSGVYQIMGKPNEALKMLEQALPIMRSLGNQQGEATALTNIGTIYSLIGNMDIAIKTLEQALSLRRLIDDRAGEAATLNNIAGIYRDTGKPQKALELLENALDIQRKAGDQVGEANILNSIGMIYLEKDEPKKAAELFEEALSLSEKVDDQVGKAVALNNIGMIYRAIGEPSKAIEKFEQALTIFQFVGDRGSEISSTMNIAILLYNDLFNPQKAVSLLKQAIVIMQETGLQQDAGGTTILQMQAILERMKDRQSLTHGSLASQRLSTQQVNGIAANTLAVLTDAPSKHKEWYETILSGLQRAKIQRRKEEIEFLTAILALLDGETPHLNTENPYARVIQRILRELLSGNTGPR